jgi:hypothetical protein
MTPAAKEAEQIAALVPTPYIPGHYYPVDYAGRSIQIAIKGGRGRQAGRNYLHVLSPCKFALKTPGGEVIDRWDGERHLSIRLSDPNAGWKEH